MTEIRISVSDGVHDILKNTAAKLHKNKSQLARELMEMKMYDLGLMQKTMMAEH